jgi:hypothetical protein
MLAETVQQRRDIVIAEAAHENDKDNWTFFVTVELINTGNWTK